MKKSADRKSYATTWAVFALLLVLVVFVFSLTSVSSRKDHQLVYSDLIKIVERKKADPNLPAQIERVVITNGDNIALVRFKSETRDRSVIVSSESKESLIKDLVQAGITVSINEADKSGKWFGVISSFILPILVLVGLLFMFRSAQAAQPRDLAGLKSFEKNKIQKLEARIAELEAELSRRKDSSV